jgi:hypothetical protein
VQGCDRGVASRERGSRPRFLKRVGQFYRGRHGTHRGRDAAPTGEECFQQGRRSHRRRVLAHALRRNSGSGLSRSSRACRGRSRCRRGLKTSRQGRRSHRRRVLAHESCSHRGGKSPSIPLCQRGRRNASRRGRRSHKKHSAFSKDAAPTKKYCFQSA